MLFQVKVENTNYIAKIVKLSALRKHSNADKLQCVLVDGNNVITGLAAKEGQLYVFFPLESCINADYLKWSNSYSSAERNADAKKKGFFNNAGRVKAIKLRGEKSEGYIVPFQDIQTWLKEDKSIKIPDEDFVAGTEFSHLGEDILFCEKYVNRDALRKLANEARQKGKKVVRVSKIIDNQFRLHIDTAPLKKNIGLLNPSDVVTISYKLHGTSGVFSKVLCKKPLKLYEKVLRAIGVKIQDTHYDYVYSSRKVIKNQYADKTSASYYDVDVWGLTNEKIKECLLDGISIYGEIVGQLPNGKWIQKDFDYGTAPNTSELYVYRITYTNSTGNTFEFTTRQMQDYCRKFNLKTVPVFYHGTLSNWAPGAHLDKGEHWHQNILDLLIKTFNEKDCFMCKNKMPEEGVVITRENEFFEPFKLKSFRFLEKESEELDKGELNIEDAESVTIPNEQQ